MIWFYLLGYIIITGSIVMDEGHQLDRARRIIKNKLHPLNIQVDITLHDDNTWTISATKQLGINVKHSIVHSTNAISAIHILVNDVNQNLDQWTDKEPY